MTALTVIMIVFSKLVPCLVLFSSGIMAAIYQYSLATGDSCYVEFEHETTKEALRYSSSIEYMIRVQNRHSNNINTTFGAMVESLVNCGSESEALVNQSNRTTSGITAKSASSETQRSLHRYARESSASTNGGNGISPDSESPTVSEEEDSKRVLMKRLHDPSTSTEEQSLEELANVTILL